MLYEYVYVYGTMYYNYII